MPIAVSAADAPESRCALLIAEGIGRAGARTTADITSADAGDAT
jgi:hypothetical protein